VKKEMHIKVSRCCI